MNHRDLWALELDSMEWVELDDGELVTPIARFGAEITYAPSLDLYVLFAGHSNDDVGNRNDMWFFDPAQGGWTRDSREDRDPTEPRGFCDFPPDYVTVDKNLPERRSSHTFLWTESCDRAVLYAGKTDCGSLDDVWHWSTDEDWDRVLRATEGESCLRWRDDPDDCSNICN